MRGCAKVDTRRSLSNHRLCTFWMWIQYFTHFRMFADRHLACFPIILFSRWHWAQFFLRMQSSFLLFLFVPSQENKWHWDWWHCLLHFRFHFHFPSSPSSHLCVFPWWSLLMLDSLSCSPPPPSLSLNHQLASVCRPFWHPFFFFFFVCFFSGPTLCNGHFFIDSDCFYSVPLLLPCPSLLCFCFVNGKPQN